MTMTIGDRKIEGKIMRREEARAVYNAAKSAGKTASLLDQERENIFTQSVANIMSGQSITVEISYVETLKYEDGAYEWIFPMTIGPRYVPAGLIDAAKVTPPVAETTRAGHDISVEVNLNAGVPVESIRSGSHDIDQVNVTPATAKVTLRDEKVIPNKDFILRYDVTGKRIEDAVLTHRDERGGFFTLMLQPPDKFVTDDRTPKEIVFLLDTSGSMSGFPIDKAKEAMRMSLDGLYPDDTFNLITFSGDTRILFDKPVPATEENLEKARAVLDGAYGGGGTEMLPAIRAALEPSDASDHVRIVCFMTDGDVGDDDEIVAEVQKHPKARVFAFGIGSSPNRSLLDRISKEGRGEAEYVTLDDDGSKAAAKFYERVRTPLLTDISIDWNGLPVADVYPSKLGDLFTAKPIVVKGRFTAAASGTIKLKGFVAGQPYERDIKVDLPDKEPANDSLATLWARQRIDELTSKSLNATPTEQSQLTKTISGLGLEFGLMTSYTSFVAVEDKVVNEGGKQVTKQVPVELPEGMKRENDSPFRRMEILSNLQKAPAVSFGGGGGGGVQNVVTVSAGVAETVDVSSTSVAKQTKRRGRGSGQGSGRGTGSGTGYGGGIGNGNGVGDGEEGSAPPRAIGRSAPVTLLDMPKPAYPEAARSMGLSGSVQVKVLLLANGVVGSAKALSGPQQLRVVAQAVARKARFEPARVNGVPVTVTGVITYTFANPKDPTSVTTSYAKDIIGDESATVAELTSFDAAETRLKQKLQVWLYDLVEHLQVGDTTPTDKQSLFVLDGKANVSIQLKDHSPATMEKLRNAGFELVREKGKNVVTGKIAPENIAALADIDEVVLVLPQI